MSDTGSGELASDEPRSASEPFAPDLAMWGAWRPEEVARRLAAVQAPWYIAGGWAIDLFLGEEHRTHEDTEIGVPQGRFNEIAAAVTSFEFFVVGDGLAWPLPQNANLLVHHHQTWIREPATGLWRVDIFREPAEDNTWICRRDPRIRLPYDRLIVRTANGIPYARPEVVLLFKAKAARPKDEADLAAVLPRLEPRARHWLTNALELVHPGHHWLSKMRSDAL